ncbi:MAG: thioesterase domain-containing protein [Acidobacteriota bacterium]
MSPSWITYRRSRPSARLRLFCFPFAGGGASTYRRWPDDFPPEVDLCPVQLPGRENRIQEIPFDALDPLVESFAESHRDWFRDLPFAFFGHSMGSLIAFELARWLRREGLPAPRHLFMSAHRAPHQPLREPPIYALPDAEFRNRLRRLNGTPEAVLQHPELMELLEPLLRADFAVNERYECRSEPPLDIPLTAYGGVEDPDVEAADLKAWGQHTTGPFQTRLFPGDHFFLQTEEGGGELRRRIAAVLLDTR